MSKVYYRPLEVDYLKGDSSKKKLWQSKININELIKEMIDFELQSLA